MNNSDLDYMELAKQNTLSIAGITETINWVVPKVKELAKDTKTTKENMDKMRDDFETYKETQRQKEHIEPYEADELASVMKNRVNFLLRDYRSDPSKYNKYYGKFMRKFWIDIKKEANVVGHSGIYTKKMHYEGAIEYAGTWIPRGYGVAGYIQHLDVLAA